MRQLLLAVALAAVAGVVGYADEDKKEEKKESPYVELRKEFMEKYTAARGDKDAQMGAFKEYAPKFLQLAEKSGKDGFDALVFGINIGSMSDSPEVKSRAIALLKKDHLENPKLVNALPMVAGLGKPATPLLKELMEKGASEKVKATACTALIEGMERSLVEAKGGEATKIKQEMGELRKVAVEKFKLKDLFVGATLPDLKSEDLNGKAVKLSDYKGKVVVLDVWATWCGPCVAMIPHERELVKKMKGKPFELISVSFDDKKETLTAFLEKNEMPWTHWYNGRKGEIGSQLDIRFFPTIFVLDGKGVIRFKGTRGEAMDKAVETLLKEMDDEKKSS